jgi:hypothetical protein
MKIVVIGGTRYIRSEARRAAAKAGSRSRGGAPEASCQHHYSSAPRLGLRRPATQEVPRENMARPLPIPHRRS